MLKKVIYFLITLIFLFSSLNLTESFNVIGNLAVYGVIGLLLFVPLLLKRKESEIDPITLFLVYFFFLFSVISSLVNSDVKSLLGAVVITLLYIVGFIIIPLIIPKTNKVIMYSILVSQLPLLTIPYLLSDMIITPYEGIFYNPNSLGTVAATVFVVVLALFLGHSENLIKGVKTKRYKMKMLIQLILLVLMFFFVMISSSRSSFGAVVICTVIGMFFLSLYLIKHKKFVSLIFRGSLFVGIFTLIGGAILRFTPLYETLYMTIIFKFQNKASQGDVLSRRGEIWSRTIKEAGLFGQGNEYFSDMNIGAHNTFISILGQYGWLSMMTFFILMIVSFVYATKYSLMNNQDLLKYLPLMLIISFMSMSMAEDMSFKLSMLGTFLSVGSVVKMRGMLKKRTSNKVSSKQKQDVISVI